MRPMAHQGIGSALAPDAVRGRLCRRQGLQRRDGALPTLPKGVRPRPVAALRLLPMGLAIARKTRLAASQGESATLMRHGRHYTTLILQVVNEVKQWGILDVFHPWRLGRIETHAFDVFEQALACFRIHRRGGNVSNFRYLRR